MKNEELNYGGQLIAGKHGWEWLILLGAAALLGASLGLLAFAEQSAWRGIPSLHYVARQGLLGLLALVLAWRISHFSLHRTLLCHWYVFPALLFLIMLAAPISHALGTGRIVYGLGWWTRSVGVGTYILALIFAASFVLPRFAHSERGAAWALAVLIALLLFIPFLFLKRWGIVITGLALIALTCSSCLAPRKLLVALSGIAIGFICVVFAQFALAPDKMQRHFNLSMDLTEKFQLRQALLAVHSGGMTGWASDPVWIPEWHTDFIFARLCGAGGLLAGTAALLALGIIFTLSWRIALRQKDLRARVLASACAAAFILPALLHVAVNLGLFPTLGINFPFLSYAPNLLLLNGLLLGLLLSLGRQPIVQAEGIAPAALNASPCQQRIALMLIWALLALFAFRMGTLVYATPYLQEYRQRQIEPSDASAREPITPARGRILDVNDPVLARNVQSFRLCADPQRLLETKGPACPSELADLIGMEWENGNQPKTDTRSSGLQFGQSSDRLCRRV